MGQNHTSPPWDTAMEGEGGRREKLDLGLDLGVGVGVGAVSEMREESGMFLGVAVTTGRVASFLEVLEPLWRGKDLR